MSRLSLVRWLLLLAIACTGCVLSEMDAPVPDVVPPAAGGASNCIDWRTAAHYGALTIDFEAMSRPVDGFVLAGLSGAIWQYSSPSAGSSNLLLRPGHDDSSKHALLSLFNRTGGGALHMQWGGCLDLTGRTGISFFAKGSAATTIVHLAPARPVDVIDHPNLPVTEDWQKFSYAWADLCLPNAADQGCPPALAGISFYQLAAAGDGDTWLSIDDVTFDRK